MLNRFYVEAPLQPGHSITLPKTVSHHLCTVLRGRVGDTLLLFNGDGNDYQATLSACGKQASVDIQTATANLCESPLQLHLLQGISRGDRMDTSIQKAVELGVTSITPLLSDKSRVRLSAQRLENKLQHWQKIIVGACEQCGRATLARLHPPQELRAYLSGLADQPDTTQRWVLDPAASARIGDSRLGSNSCELLIGPESGLSDTEIERCRAAGFSALSLGPRILRTETAGPAAIAILQARFGDLGA